MDFDTMIAEATAEIAATEATATEEAPVEVVVEAPKEEAPSTEEAAATGEEPFEGSKKEANALDRKRKQLEQRDRLLAQEREEKKQLAERLEKLERQINPERAANGAPLKLPNGEPNPDAYTDWQTYNDARTDWRLEQKQAVKPAEQTQDAPQADPQLQAWVGQRAQAVDVQSLEFIKTTPDAEVVFADNEQFIGECARTNPELLRVFLEAENAPLAFYNLAKEGKLEALISMPLARAAMEIGKAQIATPPKRTSAPKPLTASRGSVAGEKPLAELDDDAFRAAFKRW